MDLDKLNKWFNLTANLGVLAGIVFLSLEINQSNRIGIRSAESEQRQMSNELNDVDMQFPSLIVSLKARDTELSPEDKVRAMSYARQSRNLWFAAESSYTNGFMTENEYNIYLDDIEVTFNEYPGLVRFVAYLAGQYPSTRSSGIGLRIDGLLSLLGYTEPVKFSDL